jgi:uncharacterized protein (TIGR03437 family)
MALAALLIVVVSPHLCGEIRLAAVTSSANFVPGLPAPGSLASAFCTGLTGFDGIITASLPLPFSLAGVQVLVGGTPAPILALANLGGYQQINFQVPWESLGNSDVTIIFGADRATLTSTLPERWDVFYIDSSGNLAAQHASDYRPVTPADPAHPGEWIVAYATNLGPVDHAPATGSPALSDPLSPLAKGYDTYTALLSGQGIVSNYMGLVPGAVGLYQVNVRIPSDYADANPTLIMQKVRDCGFFFNPPCGRGVTITTSPGAALPFAP